MTTDPTAAEVSWQRGTVSSPQLSAIPVVVAKGIPYVTAANHRQRLNIYLPYSVSTSDLVGSQVVAIPTADAAATPHVVVHVHGGAWRDPQLTSSSIEATVAHAFAEPLGSITAMASIDYQLSPFPTNPDAPYDPVRDAHSDPSREAVHPQHVADVLRGLNLLCNMGVCDDSYLLTGHSCGACIAAQAVFASPQQLGVDAEAAPRPAALIGFNGLYDLPALVDELGASHEHLRSDYEVLLTAAFGEDPDRWSAASPALFDLADIDERVVAKAAPTLVLLDQSAEDELVPMNQRDRFAKRLGQVDGLGVVSGHRCTGRHAAPWQRGSIIWQGIQDTLRVLGDS